ncbi:MAG: lysylphosphatidylglycerol synthase transmembrane domain-containing protein [Candidatus Bathyarchaeia archaeon]
MKQAVKILLQVIVMVAIIGALLWYVGIDSLINTLSQMKLEYLPLAFLAYFGINVLFALRLKRVLKREGAKLSLRKTLFAQYAGMLTSDVTPGRSGYFLTPVYLRDQNVPTSVSLSGILGIQTVEFLFKVFGGILAVVFLIETIQLSGTLLWISVLGVVLMLVGAVLLALLSWSDRVLRLFNRIFNSKFLARFTGGLMGKLEEYKQSANHTRKSIPEIAGLTMLCWLLKGFEWYFLGLALGIGQIGWLGFFLLHPLVTALGFVPITPSGIGFQEGAIVAVITAVLTAGGIPLSTALASATAFALISRMLLILEDLLGVPQIVKSTSALFSRKNKETPEKNSLNTQMYNSAKD